MEKLNQVNKETKNCQLLALETFSSDSFLSINKRLLSYFGPNVTIFLGNLIDKYKYFIEKDKLQEDGSFFLTHADQETQTGMSEYEIRKCKKLLKKEGVLHTYMSGVPAKEFYLLNIDNLVDNYLRAIPLNFKGQDPPKTKGQDPPKTKGLYKDTEYKDTEYKDTEYKDSSSPAEDKISPKLFEKFWKMYPKKVDKGKALIKWENICTQKSWENKRPTWGEIKKAIVFQTKSERWQDKEYIPHPTTWLNQCRWLDDPKEMISYNGRSNKEVNPYPQSSPNEIIESHFEADWLQQWMKTSYEGAKKLTGADSPELANELCNLYDWIKENQNPDIPDKDYTNPDGLIKEYIFWLQFQDWVNDITPQTFSPGNNLFRKVFIGERNKETNINALTGEFIPSYE